MKPDLVKVRSIINKEIYYTSKSFEKKEIDGKKYIRILRNPYDTSKLFMIEENIEYLRGSNV